MSNSKTHCPQGHDYDEKNTYHYRGSRYCRRCLSLKLNARRMIKRYKERLVKEFGEELGKKLFEEMKERLLSS